MNFNTKILNRTQPRLKKLMIILVLALLGAHVPIFAQKISVDFKNSTIKEAIEVLRAKHNYSFSMNISDIDMSKRVTYAASNTELTDVLSVLFDGQGIDCSITGNIITVKKDKTKLTDQNKPLKALERSGTITDETGQPVIGASIIIKGTTTGTITNIDGRFSIEASADQTLVISFIGYEDQEIVVGSQSSFDVALVPSNVGLNEVVVTALGIKRAEKALSYNVQQVSNEELLKNKDANFVNALSGKVAGVNINSSSSGVGGASKVVMRGMKSVRQSNNALYVIDGVPMFNMGGEGDTEFGSQGSSEAIADINPEDIESISVLTGAAAAALYGSNAANGAIVITTKKGLAGATHLSVSSSTEVMQAFITPEFQNSYGTGDLTADVKVLDKSWGRKLNTTNHMGYDPVDDFFRTGVVNTHAVSLSTGTEKNQTYVSGSILDSKGIVPNNVYKRYNFTFRNTTSFLNDKMKLDIGGSYIHQKDRNMVNQGTYANPLVTAYLFPRGDDWSDIKMYKRYDSTRKIYTQYWPQAIDEFTGQNPYWITYRNLRENEKNRYMMNAGLSYDVNTWLNLSGRVRIDNSENNYEEKLYATTHQTIAEGSNNGLYGITKLQMKQTYADFLININERFNDDWNIHANIGTSVSDIQMDELGNKGPIRADGVPNVFNVFQLDDKTTRRHQDGYHDQTQSVFGSSELGFKGAYYLTLTARNDWPTQLAGPKSNVESFFYYSAGTSFLISEIVTLPRQIQYAKLRASYAEVGIPVERRLTRRTLVWNNANKVWKHDIVHPIENLKPEKTESWELGLTTRFLNHFNLDLSLYSAKSFNQTFRVITSASSGRADRYIQAGGIKNSGFEFSLGYQNKWRDFSWDTNYTLSSNKNEILELSDGLFIGDRLDIGGLSNARFILKKGGTLGDLYSLSDLKRDSDGKIFVDDKGEVEHQIADDIKLGSVFPKANMAWRNDFKYKNFSAGFLISARLGGIVYSATQAAMDLYGVSQVTADARDSGPMVLNGNDTIDPQEWYTTVGAQSGIPQFYTYSATNVRLQEASIGYTLPRAKLNNIADVSFSLVGRNLFMIYNKAPFDPEAVASTGNFYQGIDNFMMPSLSSVGFNVRVKF